MTARTVTRSRRSSTVTAARTLICTCGSQNEIAVDVEELMNQQLLQDLRQQEGQQGNGRAGLGCNSRPDRG
jgi:hypothetical protein